MFTKVVNEDSHSFILIFPATLILCNEITVLTIDQITARLWCSFNWYHVL